MTDREDLLKQVDRVLTRITIKYPESWNVLWRQQKHIQHALAHPEDPKVNQEKTLMKTRGWMTALMVNVPMFDEDFRPLVNEITDYFGDQKKI
jgi:hypothetical protein